MLISDRRPVPAQGKTLGQLYAGKTYRSTSTGDVYLAGRDSDGRPTMTNLDTGHVWYKTEARFSDVEAHVVITAG